MKRAGESTRPRRGMASRVVSEVVVRIRRHHPDQVMFSWRCPSYRKTPWSRSSGTHSDIGVHVASETLCRSSRSAIGVRTS